MKTKLKQVKGFDMELIDELINSGFDLKGQQKRYLEQYIFEASTYIYPKDYHEKWGDYTGI